MSNLREIKRRISTVESIAHVTDAIQKIAAARVIKAKKRAQNFKKYIDEYSNIVARLIQDKEEHPLLKPNNSGYELLVVVTQDKGLCGGFHTAVFDKVDTFIKENGKKDFQLIVCGKKGVHHYEKLQYKILLKKVNIPIFTKEEDIEDITDLIDQNVINKSVSSVNIIYNEFVSATNYEPRIKKLYPLDITASKNIGSTFYYYEPDPSSITDFIIPKYLSYSILQAFLESSASEHSARMIMMERASKNANEMIDHLTNLRNKSRQSMITSELSEIVSTIEALS